MIRNKVNQVPNYKNENIKVKTTDEWRTPDWLFSKVQAEFNLKVDRAASHENHKLDMYYTKEVNGLAYDWLFPGWANIPYSSPKLWYYKAQEAAQDDGTLTVMLTKVATSENYWIETVRDAHIRFLAGRIKFWDENNQPHYGATFPSALIIFSNDTIGNHKAEHWDYRPDVPVRLF